MFVLCIMHGIFAHTGCKTRLQLQDGPFQRYGLFITILDSQNSILH